MGRGERVQLEVEPAKRSAALSGWRAPAASHQAVRLHYAAQANRAETRTQRRRKVRAARAARSTAGRGRAE